MNLDGQYLYNAYADEMFNRYGNVVPSWRELTVAEQALLNKLSRTVLANENIHSNLAA